jgi:putative transposase
MKKSRYSEEQIVRILRETDRDSVAGVAKLNGVSEASIYGWQKRFGEMEADDVKRYKELQTENASEGCACDCSNESIIRHLSTLWISPYVYVYFYSVTAFILARNAAVACGRKQACRYQENVAENVLAQRCAHLHQQHVTLCGVMISCMIRALMDRS